MYCDIYTCTYTFICTVSYIHVHVHVTSYMIDTCTYTLYMYCDIIHVHIHVYALCHIYMYTVHVNYKLCSHTVYVMTSKLG